MIKKRSLIFSMIFLWVSVAVVAQQQQKPKVDYRSDITNVINQGELIKLTGNVAFHHNGTIITCDTAYMYEDQNFEGVGNVIINSDSTYIYGDRFTYDEETSIARVYAPLIKTIDKDAILYTHNMEFNTLTSVGSYYDGGTITQNDNLMESERGDYYTETRDMILTGKVEMKNDDYVIKTDSVGFNLETEYVTFFTKTSIWNSNDEYLEAFNGSYDRRLDLYTFTDNAYMLTAEQEVWADSIRHWSRLSESELRQNIQILDTTQKVMVFGDYGHYWANIKRIIMTKDPSALSYNPDVESDSTFMRADTLLVYPMIERGRKIIKEKTSTLDSIGMEHNFDKLQFPDSIVSTPPSDITISNDSIYKQDYLHIDTTSTDVKKEAFVPKNKKDAKQHAKALKKEAKRLAKEEKQKNKPLRGWLTAAHDHDHENCDHDHDHDSTHIDSTHLDSIFRDSTLLDSTRLRDSVFIKTAPDSSDYYIKGIDSVLVYKVDMQAICDTIVSISFDSTLHLNDNAVVWHLQNQITAQKMILFSKGNVADRAELYDFPIIAQEVEKNKYNQVRGKFMDVYFKNNELDVVFVDGNAQTIFYQEENETPVSIFNATSSSMVITFDSTQMSKINWVNNVDCVIYPLDKQDASTLTQLEGFKWENDKRPTSREQVCDVKIRESQREITERIIRPSFKLTKKIDSEKEKFIEEGTWRDRSEDIPFKVEDIILNY